MVIVHKRKADREALTREARYVGYIFERSVPLVVPQQDFFSIARHKIGESIVVIIAGSAHDRVGLRVEARFGGHILELAVPEVVEKSRSAERSSTSEEQIYSAVIVIINETSGRIFPSWAVPLPPSHPQTSPESVAGLSPPPSAILPLANIFPARHRPG